MEEEWRCLPECFPYYYVSSKGNIKRVGHYTVDSKGRKFFWKERFMKGTINKDGYIRMNLRTIEGKSKQLFLHVLIAEAFITKIEGKTEVDHINTIRTDNRVENLRWVTHMENNNNPRTKHKHAIRSKERMSIPANKSRFLKIIDKWKKDNNAYFREQCRKGSKKKKVLHLSAEGLLIKEYDSITDATRDLRCTRKSIRDYCAKRVVPRDKTIWRYKNEINND